MKEHLTVIEGLLDKHYGGDPRPSRYQKLCDALYETITDYKYYVLRDLDRPITWEEAKCDVLEVLSIYLTQDIGNMNSSYRDKGRWFSTSPLSVDRPNNLHPSHIWGQSHDFNRHECIQCEVSPMTIAATEQCPSARAKSK